MTTWRYRNRNAALLRRGREAAGVGIARAHAAAYLRTAGRRQRREAPGAPGPGAVTRDAPVQAGYLAQSGAAG